MMDVLNQQCPSSLSGVPGQLFVNLVNTLMISQCALETGDKYPPNFSSSLENGSSFDYIIVGAGSAGSVVASRLSENPLIRVLLIEAGGTPSPTSEVPNLFFALQNTPEDRAYKTEPSTSSCLGLKNKQCNWPRGKVLGGSSAINGMVYIRGSKWEYDRWESLGNKGWDFDSVLPFFKKSEKTLSESHAKSGKHGTEGLLTTDLFKSPHGVLEVLKNAAKEMGYDFYDDEVPIGYFHMLNTIENGTRCSASKAFLSKIGKRNNLFIAQNAQVGKVLLKTKQGKNVAYGVEVKIGSKVLQLHASKEIILSAGSINSPQILMNSGIGPKEHLEAKGIKVIKNLRVGENLQDHVLYTGYLLSVKDSLVKFPNMAEETLNYLVNRQGALSNIDMLNFVGFINTKNNSNYPDMQYHHILFPKGDVATMELFGNRFGYDDAIIKSEVELIKETSILKIFPTLSLPKSRGKILLNSNDPYDRPLIYSGYMTDTDDEDLKTILRGIRYLDRYKQTQAFKKHNITLLRHDIPNCRHLLDKEEFYKCSIRNVASTTYHPVGTCKMGPEKDSASVVDAKLRVHGVKNLRVIDASIMPIITTVNTNAPTIMIAERGVDFIKEKWSNRVRKNKQK